MRACPSCRRPWPDEREVCPRCLASLVDDLDATVTCPQCGTVAPARRQTCGACLALLRPEDADMGPLLQAAARRGGALHRPPGRPAFAGGVACTVVRLGARTPLVLAGPDGLIEASVTGQGIAAEPPLQCTADGRLLFRLETYAAAEEAVVTIDDDGAPLVTVLRRSALTGRLDVRDGTSAPVARVEPDRSSGHLRLVETGGAVLGRLHTVDVEREGWIDDEWSLSLTVAEEDVPLPPLGIVALPLAAKVLLGRAVPQPVRERPEPVDLLG